MGPIRRRLGQCAELVELAGNKCEPLGRLDDPMNKVELCDDAMMVRVDARACQIPCKALSLGPLAMPLPVRFHFRLPRLK